MGCCLKRICACYGWLKDSGKKPGELIWGFLFINASHMMNAIVDTVRGLA